MNTPFFTVFTPTYNRAHTLHRVFNSLSAQTFLDFEWLVVDDGSTDNTQQLIGEWMENSIFRIRYFRQPHLGRHIAHNLAIREGRGEMWTGIDSDDALVPHALETIRHLWLEIPDAERRNYLSVAGLCQDQRGGKLGRSFPSSPFDVDVREYLFRCRPLYGETWGATPMDAVRRYPFPEIAGTNFIPEGVHGLQMARAHRMLRFVNEIFRIYYVNDRKTGVTLSSRREIANSAPGRLYYYNWMLNHEMEYFRHAPAPFIRAAAMLPVVARYAGRSVSESWRELENWDGKLLVLAAMPLSLFLSLFFKVIGQR